MYLLDKLEGLKLAALLIQVDERIVGRELQVRRIKSQRFYICGFSTLTRRGVYRDYTKSALQPYSLTALHYTCSKSVHSKRYLKQEG